MIEIDKVEGAVEKKIIMSVCDETFPIGLYERENSKIIVDKIVKYAEFFCAFDKEGGRMYPIGYVAFYANDHENRFAYISMMGVLQKWQRNGIGDQLIDIVIKQSILNGMTRIRLESQKTNHRAIRFYKKHGFIDEYENDSSQRYFMFKQLI